MDGKPKLALLPELISPSLIVSILIRLAALAPCTDSPFLDFFVTVQSADIDKSIRHIGPAQ